jgi:CRISPR-associated protein Csm1
MTVHSRLTAATRVALAAYLHDLGKFAERARIPQAQEIVDGKNNTRADIEKQQYCPNFDGRHTHVHAAYTAIGFDLLEQHLPELVGADMAPFAPWQDRETDNSIINAAAPPSQAGNLPAMGHRHGGPAGLRLRAGELRGLQPSRRP